MTLDFLFQFNCSLALCFAGQMAHTMQHRHETVLKQRALKFASLLYSIHSFSNLLLPPQPNYYVRSSTSSNCTTHLTKALSSMVDFSLHLSDPFCKVNWPAPLLLLQHPTSLPLSFDLQPMMLLNATILFLQYKQSIHFQDIYVNLK